MTTTRLYRSVKTLRRVYWRYEVNGQVGFSFTEHGPTYRSDSDRFYRNYHRV